jgi:hypothetical protein
MAQCRVPSRGSHGNTALRVPGAWVMLSLVFGAVKRSRHAHIDVFHTISPSNRDYRCPTSASQSRQYTRARPNKTDIELSFLLCFLSCCTCVASKLFRLDYGTSLRCAVRISGRLRRSTKGEVARLVHGPCRPLYRSVRALSAQCPAASSLRRPCWLASLSLSHIPPASYPYRAAHSLTHSLTHTIPARLPLNHVPLRPLPSPSPSPIRCHACVMRHPPNHPEQASNPTRSQRGPTTLAISAAAVRPCR